MTVTMTLLAGKPILMTKIDQKKAVHLYTELVLVNFELLKTLAIMIIKKRERRLPSTFLPSHDYDFY